MSKKSIITEKELKEAKEQKRQFIEETDHYEEDAYQEDKVLIYYSRVTLNEYAGIAKFVESKLKKPDYDKFVALLTEFNTAVFEEYERLNYLYYELGKSKKSSNNNA